MLVDVLTEVGAMTLSLHLPRVNLLDFLLRLTTRTSLGT